MDLSDLLGRATREVEAAAERVSQLEARVRELEAEVDARSGPRRGRWRRLFRR